MLHVDISHKEQVNENHSSHVKGQKKKHATMCSCGNIKYKYFLFTFLI